jgi:signal transduction histidine kinase
MVAIPAVLLRFDVLDSLAGGVYQGTMILRWCRNAFAYLSSLGVTATDNETVRLQKTAFTTVSFAVCLLAPLWGGVYMLYDEPVSAAIPSSYSVFSATSLVLLRKYGAWPTFRLSQLLLIFALPFMLMWSLGGFIPGSAVMLWALLAPLGALWSGTIKEAVGWFVAFALAIVFSGFIDPYLRSGNNLPDDVVTFFFVMNAVTVTALGFSVLAYFVGQKDQLIEVMQRNRELEEAYLQQEITLRQSERLATLGKLSAGVAHELNNPAAAAQRAVEQLQDTIMTPEQSEMEVACLDLSAAELKVLEPHAEQVAERAQRPVFLDPIVRSDRESAMEDYLDKAGVDDAWQVSSALVSLGYEPKDLNDLASSMRSEKFAAATAALARRHATQSLLLEASQGTDRIVKIVKALKSYSYLDQGPKQTIDIHEGLDNTLVMLQSRLKPGIEVRRNYATGLPRVEAFGSELNQVWTNIIDNAIDAMNGSGNIALTTRRSGPHIVVEIADSGPGIPPEILGAVFDPFVTTKPPGSGTGLGLNISHGIVQKHRGEIAVTSRPGETRFTVKLPIDAGPAGNGSNGDVQE